MGKKVGRRILLSSNSIILKELEKKAREEERKQKKKRKSKKNKRFFKKKKKRIEKMIIKDSETLGYRSFEGEFDNLRPMFQTGEKHRIEMLGRYKGLRKNAATAVKNIEEYTSRKRYQAKNKKIRDQLSSGLCDICNIRMTRTTEVGHQPWHRETLEHVLDHELGGSLKKNELAVICYACNQTLGHQKPKLSNYENSIDIYKKELYDFFIFKQVILISQDAAARDFNPKFLEFWGYRFNHANILHKRAVSLIKDQKKRRLQKETVYWSLDCFNHSHCRKCGACNCTILSHETGHNITYFVD